MKSEPSKQANQKQNVSPGESVPKGDIGPVLDFFFENYVKDGVNFKEFIEKIERHMLIRSLSHFDGNQKKTSEFLDMKPTTMNAKCKKYRIKFIKSVE
jgi:DNA-binding NtrC family response regulator